MTEYLLGVETGEVTVEECLLGLQTVTRGEKLSIVGVANAGIILEVLWGFRTGGFETSWGMNTWK